MDEITHLNWWTLNAKKWREGNGFVTPEWIQYCNNLQFKNVWSSFSTFLLGLCAGIGIFIISAHA